MDQLKHEIKMRLTALNIDIEFMKNSLDKSKIENKNLKKEITRLQDKSEQLRNEEMNSKNKCELLESQFTRLKENCEKLSNERIEVLSQLKSKSIEEETLRIKLDISEGNKKKNFEKQDENESPNQEVTQDQ